MSIRKCWFTGRILFCLLLILFLSSTSFSTILNEDGKTQKESVGSHTDKIEWSQYRGPNRDGVAVANTSIKAWPSGSLPFQVWKKPIGCATTWSRT